MADTVPRVFLVFMFSSVPFPVKKKKKEKENEIPGQGDGFSNLIKLVLDEMTETLISD